MEPAQHRPILVQPARGFTLIEMLVVLAIIVVLTAVAILGQGQFNRSILLTDTAYTVALSIRQAQTFGFSSRVFSSVTNTGYGVHFGAGTSDQYQIFADLYPVSPGSVLGGLCPGHTALAGAPNAKPGDCVYASGVGQDGVLQTFRFDRGFTVGYVCGHVSSNPATSKCIYNDGRTSDFTSIDISFLRPNTQSVVIGTDANNNYTALSDACIHIAAPNGPNTNGNIFVSYVGEVAVVDTCP